MKRVRKNLNEIAVAFYRVRDSDRALRLIAPLTPKDWMKVKKKVDQLLAADKAKLGL
jgi:hypothetical protein